MFGIILVLLGVLGVLSTPLEKRFGDDSLQRLSTANNELALNLHRRLSSTGGNVFFSPLSISSAFAMLHYGARGDTAQELRNALGYTKANLPNNLVHVAFKKFLGEVLRTGDASNEYVLNSANAILVDKHLQLVPGYKDEVEDFFGATVHDVDFRTESAAVVDDINRWVREKTNGKIESLLEELSPSTVSVLLNAVYFKGTWRYQFKPEHTIQQRFYNNGVDSGAKHVPMMHITARFNYAKIDDFQVLELPYKGDNISMVILLPDRRDGLSTVEDSLDLDKLATIDDELYETKVKVSLPKFKMEYTKELSQDMMSLGAKKIFGAADFSGMTLSQGVSVSQVVHKAVVEVNEEGSEAAAVTGIIENRMSIIDDTPRFQADHPFLFAIVEKGEGRNMILFMGRVNSL